MAKNKMVLFCAVLLTLLPGTAGAFRLSGEWQKSFSPGPNPVLTLDNVDGNLSVEGWDRPTIEITAEIRVKAPSKWKAERLYRKIEFRTGSDSGRVSVEAHLPIVRQDSFLDVFSDGFTAIRIRYHAKVPRSTSVYLRTVNGGIRATGTEGSFDVATQYGSVEAEFGGGGGRIETVDGSVELTMRRFSEKGDIEVKTVHGEIELVLPEGSSAKIEAKSAAGGVSIELPLREQTVAKRGLVEGVLGAGSGAIRLETVTGDITVTSGLH
jgi:hypothetical protein